MKAHEGAPIDINQPSGYGDFELVVRAVGGKLFTEDSELEQADQQSAANRAGFQKTLIGGDSVRR